MSEADYKCAVCGHSSESLTVVECEGEPEPCLRTSYVYCYRQHRPVGLCNCCFAAGRLEIFTPAEIEYFRESFADCEGAREMDQPDATPD